jgi:NAD(P)-dependent dehydrogenase (short-subunit alcohol dehydrogenase family)
MNDVLGYSGRRCIVTGAASGIGEAATRILVDLGAEVHTLDIRKPDIIGIASFSETDLRDPDVVGRAIDAIGAVVNNLFNCAELALDATHEVSERVIPNMIDGAAISSLADADGSIARYTATRAVDLVELGIRINCIGSSGGEDRAWPLVLLGSPRSSSLTGLDLSS